MADSTALEGQAAESLFVGHKFKALTPLLLKSLKDSEIYFSPPEKLNDPFDCQIDLIKAHRLALAHAGRAWDDAEGAWWQPAGARINELVRTCGVFSLCKGEVIGKNSQLFWPHYGDDHKGVCLTYGIPEPYIHQELVGISPVEYTTGKLLNALGKLRRTAIPSDEDMHGIVQALLTTKSEVWSYEEEFRLVASTAGTKKIGREWLKQICFGLRVEKSQKLETIAAMKKWGYTACVFSEVLLSETGLVDFDIRTVDGV